MAEKKIKWTDQQKRAIEARGSDVLVTASAGTGKTAVLSGRCVNIVSDKSVCPDVWSILVLTFTDMAAEQMRSRIAQRLRDEFMENRDSHLLQQLILLGGADISTIHSFCKRLITEYFYKLSLDPTFSVIDADEAKLLKAEVLEKTIDWAWQQSNIRAAFEQLLYRRDLRTTDGFPARIIELSDFLDGVVSRQRWYERASQLAEAANPLTGGLGQKQKQIIADKLHDILAQLRHAQQLAESEAAADQSNWLRNTHIKPVAQCIEFIKSGDWDRCVRAIRDFDKPKTYTPKGLPESIAAFLQSTAKAAVDAFKELSQLAMVNPSYLDRLSSSVGLQTRVLIELVKKFERLYSQAKRAVNCLDFADLEHYALELLTDEGPSEDTLSPSQTALALRQRYKYIFVDEYQDINPVQQAILDALSSSGNVFVVGDVKQSIYAWRGAQPQIFLERLKPASVDPTNAPGGLRVDLNANFRSVKGILDFVNRIFSRIMTSSFTKINYDQSAQLIPAVVSESQSPDRQGGVSESQSPDRQGGVSESQSPNRQGGVSESQSPDRQGGVSESQSPDRQGGVSESQSPDRQGGVSESQSPDRQGGVSESQIPDREGGVSESQSPDRQGGVSESQSPDRQGGVSESQSPDRQGGVSELQSPDRKGGVSGRNNVVEFHILDETSRDQDLQNEQSSESADDEALNVISSRQRQAAVIAQRIRQMVGADSARPEFQIYDREQDCLRDVQYRDIVVLMRSLAKKANDYVEVLRLAGVPVSCQQTAGYFEATEISDLLCLLKVLDNPQRDIELSAVLRSPFFKVSDTELAKIKINSSKITRQKVQSHEGTKAQSAQAAGANFYDCVLRYCDNGPDTKLAGRLKEIIAQIEKWRTVARRGNLADLIWQVYRQTNFLSFVSALPNGQARRANLLKLHDRAVQFEGFASSSGIPSLTRFVDFIEKLQEVGQDWAPAEPQSAAGNAVRILSVHKSKGLEFPVVFLAELDSKFNKKDIFADCLADADDTLGLQVIDRESNSKLRSLAHEVIAEQKLSMMLAEEMRILYVATTRARDRLILTASQKQISCRQIITDGFWLNPYAKDRSPITNHQLPITTSIPDWQLRRCQSPLEWVLYALFDQKVLHDAFETHLSAEAVDDGLFNFKLYSRSELKQLSDFVIRLKKNKLSRTHPTTKMKDERRGTIDQRPGLLAQVKDSLARRYQFGDAPLLPAKTSVTELTHRNDEYIKFDYSRVLERQPAALMAVEPAIAEPLESRLIGIATHLVISQLDLTGSVTREAIEKTKRKLLADNAITTAVAEHIDTDSILAFFQSELGRMALDKQNAVQREWPFTFALPASFVARDSSFVARFTIHDSRFTDDEVVIIQGIIDMLVRTPKGLVVIDFKTDRVTAGEVNQRAEFYRPQLELYGRAASAILKSKSIGKWLYFLTPGCEVDLK